MKKLYKELIWFILSFIATIILSFFILKLLKLNSIGAQINEIEKLFLIQLYFIVSLITIIFIYLVRLIVYLLKK
jgi:hypothetical protein